MPKTLGGLPSPSSDGQESLRGSTDPTQYSKGSKIGDIGSDTSSAPDHDKVTETGVANVQPKLFRTQPDEQKDSQARISNRSATRPKSPPADVTYATAGVTDNFHSHQDSLLTQSQTPSSPLAEAISQSDESSHAKHVPRLDTKTPRRPRAAQRKQKFNNASSKLETSEDKHTDHLEDEKPSVTQRNSLHQSPSSGFAPDFARRFSKLSGVNGLPTEHQSSADGKGPGHKKLSENISPRQRGDDWFDTQSSFPDASPGNPSPREKSVPNSSRSLRNKSQAAIAGYQQDAEGNLEEMNPEEADIVQRPDGINVTKQLIESGLLDKAYSDGKVGPIKDFERMIFHLLYANKALPNIQQILLRNRRKLWNELEAANVPTPTSAREFLDQIGEPSEQDLRQDERGRQVIQIARRLLETQPLDNDQTCDFVFLLEEEFIIIMLRPGYFTTCKAIYNKFCNLVDFAWEHLIVISIIFSAVVLTYLTYNKYVAISSDTLAASGCLVSSQYAPSSAGVAVPLVQGHHSSPLESAIWPWIWPFVNGIIHLYHYSLQWMCWSSVFGTFLDACRDLFLTSPGGAFLGLVTLFTSYNTLHYIGPRVWRLVSRNAIKTWAQLKKHSFLSTIGALEIGSWLLFDFSPIHRLGRSILDTFPLWAILLAGITVFGFSVRNDPWWRAKFYELKDASSRALATFKEGVTYSVVFTMLLLGLALAALAVTDYLFDLSLVQWLQEVLTHDDLWNLISAWLFVVLAFAIVLFMVHLGPESIVKGMKNFCAFLVDAVKNMHQNHPWISVIGSITVICPVLEYYFDWVTWPLLFGCVSVAACGYLIVFPLCRSLYNAVRNFTNATSAGALQRYTGGSRWCVAARINALLEAIGCPAEIRYNFRLFLWVVFTAAILGNLMRAGIYPLQAPSNALDVKVLWSDEVDQPVVYLT